jgi:hypothetical protein
MRRMSGFSGLSVRSGSAPSTRSTPSTESRLESSPAGMEPRPYADTLARPYAPLRTPSRLRCTSTIGKPKAHDAETPIRRYADTFLP